MYGKLGEIASHSFLGRQLRSSKQWMANEKAETNKVYAEGVKL